MRVRRSIGVLAAMTLIFAACGDDEDDAAPPADGGGTEVDDGGGDDGGGEAQTFTVQVDARADDLPLELLTYFPRELQVHPGDTVEFAFADNGVPHTASGGRALNELFDLIESTGFDLQGDAPPPPEVDEAFSAIPFVFPDDPTAPLNQGAAQACVAEAEPLPVEEPCEIQEGRFSGVQQLWSTGFVPPGETFTMEIASDAAAGDYTFMCLVHGPAMTMELSVVDADTEVPSAEEVEEATATELEEAFETLRPMAEEIRASTDPTAAPAGGISEDLPYESIVSVFPDNLEIAAGEAVTWQIAGPHTVSFGAPESARPIIMVAADGTVQINGEGAAPAGWAGPPPPPDGPPDPSAPPPVVDAGSYSGEGYHNSSLLFGPLGYRLTFDTPGTYEYICVVHPDMEGTVTVT